MHSQKLNSIFPVNSALTLMRYLTIKVDLHSIELNEHAKCLLTEKSFYCYCLISYCLIRRMHTTELLLHVDRRVVGNHGGQHLIRWKMSVTYYLLGYSLAILFSITSHWSDIETSVIYNGFGINWTVRYKKATSAVDTDSSVKWSYVLPQALTPLGDQRYAFPSMCYLKYSLLRNPLYLINLKMHRNCVFRLIVH